MKFKAQLNMKLKKIKDKKIKYNYIPFLNFPCLEVKSTNFNLTKPFQWLRYYHLQFLSFKAKVQISNFLSFKVKNRNLFIFQG